MKISFRHMAYKLNVLLFAVYPLVSANQFLRIGPIGLDNLLIVVSFVLSILHMAVACKINGLLLLWFLIYFLIGILAMASGSTSSGLPKALTFIQSSFLVVIVGINKDKAIPLLQSFLIGATIAALFGILQAVSIWAWEITNNYYLRSQTYLTSSLAYKNRIASVSFFPPNGNFFGSYMVFAIYSVMFLRSKYKKHCVQYLLLSIFIVGLILSLSWTSLASLLLGFLIYKTPSSISLVIKKSKFAEALTVMVFAIILINITLMAFYDKIKDKFVRYFLHESSTGTIRGLDTRYNFWQSIICDNTSRLNIFGIGYDSVALMDNFYLELFIVSGPLALFAFLVFMFGYGVVMYKHKSKIGIALFFSFAIMNLTAAYGIYVPVLSAMFLVAALTLQIKHRGVSFERN